MTAVPPRTSFHHVLLLVAMMLASCSTSIEEGTSTSTSLLSTPALGVASTTHSSTTVPVEPVPAETTTIKILQDSLYVGPGPTLGDVVAVVGVDHDDVLNVRAGPGTDHAIVFAVGPMVTGITVTGRAVESGASVWYEVGVSGESGWVNGAYISMLGATDDATSELAALLGSPLADDDLLSLGASIANSYLAEEGGGWIALVDLPVLAASPSIVSHVYDVIGLADDSIKGYRLVIHSTTEVASGLFLLHSVERTSMCWRGVDSDGLCL